MIGIVTGYLHESPLIWVINLAHEFMANLLPLIIMLSTDIMVKLIHV
jgi:hypothetical protein